MDPKSGNAAQKRPAPADAERRGVYITREYENRLIANPNRGGTTSHGVPGSDFTGNGKNDILVTQPRATNLIDGTDPGGGYGTVEVWTLLSSGPVLALNSLNQNDLFGLSVKSAGDLDGDGAAELVIGAPLEHGDSGLEGAVYVHSGSDGQLLMVISGEEWEYFGRTVAGASDHDADGQWDIAASSWVYDQGQPKGMVSIHSGSDGALIRTYTSPLPDDGFGYEVISLGDLDADADSELAIPATLAPGDPRAYAPATGRLYIFDGAVRAASPEHLSTADAALTIMNPDPLIDHFGVLVELTKDEDNDGAPDLLVTSIVDPYSSAETTAMQIYSSASGDLLWPVSVGGTGSGRDGDQLPATDDDGNPILYSHYTSGLGVLADATRDLRVEQEDLMLVANAIGNDAAPGNPISGDVSLSGLVDLPDVNMVVTEIGNHSIIRDYVEDTGRLTGRWNALKPYQFGDYVLEVPGRVEPHRRGAGGGSPSDPIYPKPDPAFPGIGDQQWGGGVPGCDGYIRHPVCGIVPACFMNCCGADDCSGGDPTDTKNTDGGVGGPSDGNFNGIPDAEECINGNSPTSPNCPNPCEDDDGDGIPNQYDCDSICFDHRYTPLGIDGRPCSPCADDDGDGTLNQADCDSLCFDTGADFDGDGFADGVMCSCRDSDEDGISDADEDDDCDGIPNHLDCDSVCFEGDPACCEPDPLTGMRPQDDPEDPCSEVDGSSEPWLRGDSNNDSFFNDADDSENSFVLENYPLGTDKSRPGVVILSSENLTNSVQGTKIQVKLPSGLSVDHPVNRWRIRATPGLSEFWWAADRETAVVKLADLDNDGECTHTLNDVYIEPSIWYCGEPPNEFFLSDDTVSSSHADRIFGLEIEVYSDDCDIAYSIGTHWLRYTSCEVSIYDARHWDPAEGTNGRLAFNNTDLEQFTPPDEVVGAVSDGAAACIVRFNPPIELPGGSLYMKTTSDSPSTPDGWQYHGTMWPVWRNQDDQWQMANLPVLPMTAATPLLEKQSDLTWIRSGVAVYVPPDSYVDPQHGPGGGLGHNASFLFDLDFEISRGSGANASTLGRVPFKLARPPLMVAHGLGASPAVWTHNFESGDAWNASTFKTHVRPFDYSPVAKLGYDVGFLYLPDQIQELLDDYRSGSIQEVDNQKFAIARIDYIGNSMGGVIGRLHASNLAFNGVPRRHPRYSEVNFQSINVVRDGNSRYYNSENLFAGAFRRFIAIGSPLNGSGLATVAIDLSIIKTRLAEDNLEDVAARIQDELENQIQGIRRRHLFPNGLWVNPMPTPKSIAEAVLEHAIGLGQDYQFIDTALVDLAPNSEIQLAMDQASYIRGSRSVAFHTVAGKAGANAPPGWRSWLFDGALTGSKALVAITAPWYNEAIEVCDGDEGDLVVKLGSAVNSIGSIPAGSSVYEGSIHSPNSTIPLVGVEYRPQLKDQRILNRCKYLLGNLFQPNEWSGNIQ
ncbi:MAG: hypothetical protein ABL309_01805 [Phycisphaerales bacterium]